MLAADARIAVGAWERLIGLMGKQALPSGYALGISECDWVHAVGVRIPLDVAYCDREGRVLRLVRNLLPGRIAPRVSGACIAWEMEAGTLGERLVEGQRLVFHPNPENRVKTKQRNV